MSPTVMAEQLREWAEALRGLNRPLPALLGVIAGLEQVASDMDAERRCCPLEAAAPDLLAVCEEIAADARCDLVHSERRMQLYHAIRKAGGTLAD